MKSFWIFTLFFPFLSFAQSTIYVPELGAGYAANGNNYRRMMFSDNSTVTLLSVGLSDITSSFHRFNLSDGSLVSIKKAVCPSFDLQHAVSKLPNIQVGAVSYPNILFTGVRNDSVFLVNTKFTQSLDFVEVLDFAYLSESDYFESTDAIINPDNGDFLTFLSFFPNSGGDVAHSHALVKIAPDHHLEVALLDSVESQKLAVLRYVRDLSLLDGYYYITGYTNSPLSAILDGSLKVVNKGNTNYYDPVNSNNDFSLRGYVTRQITANQTAIIGDGNFNSSFPPKIKTTSQIVKVENEEIIFQDRTEYATLNRQTSGIVATFTSSVQPALFIVGIERETPDEITTSYIYIKKLVNGEEVSYKRYGDDLYYYTLHIDYLENGNLVICGFSISNFFTPARGFFMFLNQEGDPVNTNQATPIFHVLPVFPQPTTDRLYTNIDLTNDALWIVTDRLGKVISSEKNMNRGYLDVSNLLPGMYFLNVCSDSKIYTSKFIKS